MQKLQTQIAMKKISTFLFCSVLTALSLRADVLFRDSSNYPYANGCIEGQGQWYCYYPKTPIRDALVTNNVLILNATNHDEVAAPTNGWVNLTYFNFASFAVNVSQLPSSPDGGYFCQLQNNNGTNNCCHVFIDTRDTVVPGTYRLGVANFSTSFANLVPPVNYPMDLATGITYTVVILFDNNPNDFTLGGATLWINPSEQDYQNAADGYDISPGIGDGFVYGLDTAGSWGDITQIGFSPYVNAGISNVMAGTSFDDVNTTNLPVFGVQPPSGTNYSGNSATFYAVASGVDLTYQWYSRNSGLLHDDGVNVIGSTSNILVINNLSASDSYYVVATDAYGQTATSATATYTVITTPTAPFFPASTAALHLTNNLFTYSGFTDFAEGTGPMYYQWYFAPTNTPNTYTPLAGQTNAALALYLADYTYSGNYYVVASNALAGGSIALGPTNSLTEIAPVVASISQLHNLMISMASQVAADKNGTIWVNTNNVTVGGYVTTYGGFGNTYGEYFIQDAAGYGIEVYVAGVGNTNTPPVGTYVTVTGPVEIYHTELEIAPTSLAAITTNLDAPPIALTPRLENANFNDLSTNGLGTNAILLSGSLVTFTNVYLYGSSSGGAFGTGGSHSGVGGIFYTNGYTALYFTMGAPYDATTNQNTIESYQFGYDYGTNRCSFYNQTIPTHCAQITGVYLSYGGTPEILPSRFVDYATNPPPSFAASARVVPGTKGGPTTTTINWPAQAGSTYSVYSATSLLGPWTQAAYGLAYYPTNGAFTDTNSASVKFYRVNSP
jgi:hypothetical protein